MPRTKQAIRYLLADDSGRAWVVRTGTPAHPAMAVFGPDGRHVANVVGSGPIGAETVIMNGVLLTVITDADDIPFVVRYRIDR